MKLFMAVFTYISLAASLPMSNDTAQCRPNFQGSAVRVQSELSSSYVWSVPRDANVGSPLHADLPSHAAPAAWLWQIDGTTPANFYNARLFGAAANNLVVGQDASRRLALVAVNYSGNNPQYDIQCSYCMPPGKWVGPETSMASGCAIVDVADAWYAQDMPDGSIQFQAPDEASAQKWSFVSV